MNSDVPPEHEILESIISSDGSGRPDWRLVFDVLLSGNVAIADQALGFVAVTLAAACIKFGILWLAPGLPALPAGANGGAVRWFVLWPVATGILVSAIYGFAGVRWCRRIVLQDTAPPRPKPFGASECLFAICFLVLIALASGLDFLRPAVERWLFPIYPWPFFIYVVFGHFLLWVLEASLLFLVFPAIAVGAAGAIRQGLKLARGLYPELFAIYLLGFLPWRILQFAADSLLLPDDPFTYNAYLASSMLRDTVEFLTMSCGIVLAATVYRYLVISGDTNEVATVFD